MKSKVEDKRDYGAFIPAHLDDYGLDPFEFRIYARMSRRAGSGDHYEAVSTTAKDLKISPRIVNYAHRLFELCGMVHKQSRKGQTSIYSLRPGSEWSDKKSLPELREKIKKGDPRKKPKHKEKYTSACGAAPTSAPSADLPLHHVQTTSAPCADKGTPLKETSKKEPAEGGLTASSSFFEEEFGIELPFAARKANPERLKGICRKNRLNYEQVRVALAELQAWHEDDKITGTVETAFGQLAGWAKAGSLYLSARGEEILLEGSG